jgi:hypothetical protein
LLDELSLSMTAMRFSCGRSNLLASPDYLALKCGIAIPPFIKDAARYSKHSRRISYTIACSEQIDRCVLPLSEHLLTVIAGKGSDIHRLLV